MDFFSLNIKRLASQKNLKLALLLTTCFLFYSQSILANHSSDDKSKDHTSAKHVISMDHSILKHSKSRVEVCQSNKAKKMPNRNKMANSTESSAVMPSNKPMSAMNMESSHHKTKMPHMDHNAKHDGVFFMAPSKTHHIEGVYSKKCGFQLYIYDAYTQPLTTSGFQAFIKVIQGKEDEEYELVHFLTQTKGSMVLQTSTNLGIEEHFVIELYLDTPENDTPDVYTFGEFN